ncbi:hypothetical protein FA95DRAFT_1550470 [Auriscalpium vulgare]|uniref:Uncharacterized protein n=1 Tax=Auriscalpium vulgare TaxID=40419 RepID=A0ACB8R6I9_9AGAM|nr:hypothetical protein FA95DRAFT_1550470 [Auriscalpium vulgare]
MSASSEASTSSRPPEIDRLLAESARRRDKINSEIDEADDPLALYDQFVKWTFEKYPQEYLASSGIVEMVEEATRKFKNDASYKSDLRYLKLWALYASLVDKPGTVYKFVFAAKIGTVYAYLYEEYGLALEREGRHQAADEVYRAGIQRKARPLERLKKRYDDFRRRTASKPTISPPKAAVSLPKGKGTPAADLLRRQPLKNYNIAAPTPAASTSANPARAPAPQSQPPASASPSAHSHNRYAPMLTLPPSGKREKLQVNMGLLFTPEGVEYSMPEARARSMGFLGKKWPPPPTTQRVDFNDGGHKGKARRSIRKSFAGEPTVTITTKGALADVFEMYNSPERTIRLAPGTKHAPVRKIEPVTPMAPLLTDRSMTLWNENSKSTPAVQFRFADENAKSSAPAKFTPYVDPSAGQPAVTPVVPRRALGEKEVPTPAPALTPAAKLALKPEEPLLSRVFTPVARGKDENSINVSRSSVDEPAVLAQPAKFTPFVDGSPLKVFSRPPEKPSERVLSSKPSAFTPYVDEELPNPPSRAPLGGSLPLRSFAPSRTTDADESPEDDDADRTADSSQDDEDYISFVEAEQQDAFLGNAPLGGRFGTFDVMTPITERTFEMTTSSRLSLLGGGFAEPEAIEAAEKLAAELREGERDDSAGFAFVEDKTGTLSLSDAIAVASEFNPPNPCNPFDPPIVSTLLSLLAANPEHHDYASQEANVLDGLQKLARKQASGRAAVSLAGEVSVKLGDRRFSVFSKLGEGGFGAVFSARDVSSKNEDADEDDYDMADDEDEDESKCVALKIVKPRNLWEFYVLRKVHSSLPARLRASVIRPHSLYTFRDESFLILDLCTQGSLLDIVNNAGKAGVSQQGACLDELLVMFFAIEFLRLVEGIHTAGFIHGDLKIDNCLIRLDEATAWSGMYDPSGAGGWAAKGIKLIDFGRTIDTRMFPHGQTYIAEWAVDARDCVEMREERPWTYQSDYFGLAGIVYCMLFGKYIEASSVAVASNSPRRFKIATPFKRYWQTEIWTSLFDALLNPCLMRPDGHLPVCEELSVVRGKMETWLQANCNRSSNTLKGLLKKVELSVIRDS